jgi:hypothetical protein
MTPDVIHAQHHLDSMTAITALPGIPAVYCCHGATRSDAQPKHPRILHYVTVTETLRLRMAIESNIPLGMIEVVHNAVDLKIFSRARQPPDRPQRALVYSRVVMPDNPLGAAIRAAALGAGLQLEFSRSLRDDSPIVDPQELLVRYDIVFASGKSAIDALACGCAVIVLGAAAGGWAGKSSGEMVDMGNFERLRQANFSLPVNAPPPSIVGISEQISRYTPRNTADVSSHLRQIANVDAYVDRFLAIYRRVIDLAQTSAPDPRAEQRAAYAYLRSISPWALLADEERSTIDRSPRSGDAVVRTPDRVLNGPTIVGEVKRSLASIERHCF